VIFWHTRESTNFLWNSEEWIKDKKTE